MFHSCITTGSQCGYKFPSDSVAHLCPDAAAATPTSGNGGTTTTAGNTANAETTSIATGNTGNTVGGLTIITSEYTTIAAAGSSPNSTALFTSNAAAPTIGRPLETLAGGRKMVPLEWGVIEVSD